MSMTEAEEPELCSAELRPGSLVDPPEFCEEEAAPGSDLCYWHDPDGAAADRAESLAEDRRAGLL